MSCGCDENKDYEGEIDVTKSLKVRLYPNKKQKKSFDQNIANRGFIWNRLLEKCKYENVKPTAKNLNENGIYVASINIDTQHKILKKPKSEGVGIDLGIRRPATCSNKQIMHPIDLNKEEKNIKYYQKEMSKRHPGSIRYRDAQDKYRKWMRKKINKKTDTYHKFTHYIVKNYGIIGLETLNIKGWFKNGRWAPKLQKISVYEIIRQLKYKAKWNNRILKQVGMFFPSSQLCSECYYKNEDLKMGEEEWDCPECHAHHDRDLNASINIREEAIRLASREKIKNRYEKAFKRFSLLWPAVRGRRLGNDLSSIGRAYVEPRIPNFYKLGKFKDSNFHYLNVLFIYVSQNIAVFEKLFYKFRVFLGSNFKINI